MKFAYSAELDNFIRSADLFVGALEMREIYCGGSSYNFYIRTTEKEYMLKLIDDEKRYTHLKNILQRLNVLQNLPEQSFHGLFILVLPYYAGHKITYKDMNTTTAITDFFATYQQMQNALTDFAEVLPALNMAELVSEIDTFLMANNDFFCRIINKLFWQKFKSRLVTPHTQKNVLHGDLTANNILVHNGAFFLLDFELVRYGAETEDMAGLLLQLSGFRALYGNLRAFAKLYHQLNELKSYTPSDWLYGVQMFYINTLLRRLRNADKKRRNWRKSLCLLIILSGYWRVDNFLNSQRQ